jgi:hypothetical protein
MASAALRAWDHLACTRSALATAASCALLLAACSVYTEELVEGDESRSDDDSLSGSGETSTGGKGSLGLGGKSGGIIGGGSGNGSMTDGGAGSMSSGGTQPGPAGTAGETPGGESGSSGSGSAEAGSSGSGGAGSAGTGGGGAPVTSTGDLLDGFEDVDLTLEQTAGRGGVWYLFDDGTVGKAGPTPLTCTELVSAPVALGSYAMHITATGFTGWGSGLGVDFRAGKKVYSGGAHTGIRFWARVAEGKNTRHRVQLVDGTSDALGGKCDPAVDAVVGTQCDDHFGINLVFSSSWAQYWVPFADLTQVGWGHAAPSVDKTTLYGLQVTAKAKLEVDLWLDQIEFF